MTRKKYGDLTLAGLMVIVTGCLILLFPQDQYSSAIFLFVIPVLVSSMNFGRREGIAASILSFVMIDFLFIEPYFGFVPVSFFTTIPLFVFLFVVLAVHLVVERKKVLEKTLFGFKRDREVAVQVRRLQHSIINNIDHEIRTPLSSILGYSDFIVDEALKKGIRSSDLQIYAERVRNSSEHLLGLIENLVELSLEDSDVFDLSVGEIEIQSFMRFIEEKYSRKAAVKGLKFEIITGKNLPEKITSDKVKLLRLLDDILDNAIKFTDAGSVVVKVEHCENPIANCIAFKVIDSGVGISDSVVQSIFDPFFRGEVSDTKSRGGIGLGLAHARKFAKTLGGDVELIQTDLGRGSTFEIKIDSAMRA